MAIPELLPLDEMLQAEFKGEWRADLATITGQRSNRDIAQLVERLALEELGEKLRGALFVSKSVGAVFGLELLSGERVVLKLFHRSQLATQLAAMQRCVNTLVASGFPVPPPRSRLFQTDDGISGAFYTFMDGTMRDAHESGVRRELARVLAELTGILEHENPVDLPLAPTRGSELWPAPHRSFLTLPVSHDVQWIDEIGLRAQSVVRAAELPLVPTHLDWGVKNCRFHDDRVCVVYDWDSLFAGSEAEMVGRAAAQFTAQWDFPAALTPSRTEARAFVEEYETARGRAFASEERIVLAAAADYLVAQVARLELASGNPRCDGFLSQLRASRTGILLDDVPGTN